jgi:tryptophan 2,3-dioxygenase
MTPDEFNRFRKHLNPASGFQSHQFRVLEYSLGLKDKSYFRYYKHDPISRAKLEEALAQPSIYDRFIGFLRRQGFDLDEPKILDTQRPFDEKLATAITDVYRQHLTQHEIYGLLEAMVDIDELFTLWRFRHMLMVERMIGSLGGTGGSLGAKYLASTVEKRLFPEIWAVRSNLGAES